MAVNSTALKANVRAVGDLFFSGSQTVTKGDEVIWILDETYAFKVTEKCAVSTNASPFVNLQAGDVFIIYKRTEADIQAKNAKGIYIFDRDTVVGLAYPQEVTQDIVIENDIYANNYNSVVIEADKTPTAKITVSNMQPTIGDIIKIDSSSSYAVSPSTINSWRWKKNGVSVSTSPHFSYKVDRVGQDDITLVITDTDGRKADAQVGIMIKAKPVVPPPVIVPPPVKPPPTGTPPPTQPPSVIFTDVSSGGVHQPHDNTKYSTLKYAHTGGEKGTLDVRISVTAYNEHRRNHYVSLYLYHNGNLVKSFGEFKVNSGASRAMSGSVVLRNSAVGGVWEIKGSSRKFGGSNLWIGGKPDSSSLQITVTDRTH